jgi:hypothetical protein
MTTVLIALLVAMSSLASQINLKVISAKLFLDSKFIVPANKWYLALLVLQAGVPALISLLITIFGYSRFSFFHFMVIQSLYFVFAIIADITFFGGQFSIRNLLAMGFVLIGIALATVT